MAGEHGVGVFGLAQHLAFLASAGRGAGSELRHHAIGRAARGLQRLQGLAQPGAVAYGHPGRAAGLRARLQGKVQLGRVVEQLLFQQAVEHGAQPRALRQRARGQRHALPGQGAHRHHGHHFAGAARVGQQGGAGAGLLGGVVAVDRERVAVVGGGLRRAQGQGDDEGAHGMEVGRGILGPSAVSSRALRPPRSRHRVRTSPRCLKTRERSSTTAPSRRSRPRTSK